MHSSPRDGGPGQSHQNATSLSVPVLSYGLGTGTSKGVGSKAPDPTHDCKNGEKTLAKRNLKQLGNLVACLATEVAPCNCAVPPTCATSKSQRTPPGRGSWALDSVA